MREIKTVKVYNLVNSKGNKLRLNLGLISGPIDEYLIDTYDKGWRWSFEGYRIPMPVRSGYWFNGFTESVMLDWLKGNGWHLHTVVNMPIGTAVVYELPNGNENPVECEPFGTDQYPPYSEMDKPAFEDVIRELYSNGRKLTAIRLYRYAHGGLLSKAKEAVEKSTEIVDRQISVCYN